MILLVRMIALVAVVSALPLRPLAATSAFAATPAFSATPRFDAATRTWTMPRAVDGLDAALGGSGGEGNEAGPALFAPPVTAAPLASTWIFSPNTRTHPETTGQHLWPDIEVSAAGVVGVVWMGDAPGGMHIFYSQSTDGAATWSAPEEVDTRTGGTYSKFPDIEFTPAGTPVVVWEDDRTGGFNVYVAARDSAAVPNHWARNIRVNTTGGAPSTYDFMNASLAVLDEKRWFVAWTDWREGVYNQVYMRATPNAGAAWTPESRVSDEIGYEPVAGDPCIVVDPASGPVFGRETLYLVMDDWRGYAPGGRYPNAYFSRSVNGGHTWSTGVRVNDIEPWFQQVSSQALVKLDDGTLTAGWLNSDFVVSEFRVSVSADGGATWGASVPASPTPSSGVGTWSSLTSSGNQVFAGFDYWSGTDWDAYFRASADGGRSWTEPALRVDDDTTQAAVANTVVAAWNPATVYAAWEDSRPSYGPWLIYATRAARLETSVGAGAAGSEGTTPGGASSMGGASAAVRLAAHPNPARGGEMIRFVSPAEDVAGGAPARELDIYDLAGRLVRRLDIVAGGADWDGTDGTGRAVAPGIYRARVSGGDGATSIPVLVVR